MWCVFLISHALLVLTFKVEFASKTCCSFIICWGGGEEGDRKEISLGLIRLTHIN